MNQVQIKPAQTCDTVSLEGFLVLMNEVHTGIVSNGWTTNDFVQYQGNKWVNVASAECRAFMQKKLSRYNFLQLVEFKTITTHLHTTFTEELSRIVAILNAYLPRMRELDLAEQQDYRNIDRVAGFNNLSPQQMTQSLVEENPAYVRRALTLALELGSYQSKTRNLTRDDLAEMDLVASSAETMGKVYDDSAALKMMLASTLDTNARPQLSGVPRYDMVLENLSQVTRIAQYGRPSREPLAKLMIGLPTTLAWCIGSEKIVDEGDQLINTTLDLFNLAVNFNKQMQLLSKRAAKVRYRLSLGYPDYTDFREILKEIDQTVVWALESFLFRLARVLPVLVKKVDTEGYFANLLQAAGVLTIYQHHKAE